VVERQQWLGAAMSSEVDLVVSFIRYVECTAGQCRLGIIRRLVPAAVAKLSSSRSDPLASTSVDTSVDYLLRPAIKSH